jgi:hypothetical protein
MRYIIRTASAAIFFATLAGCVQAGPTAAPQPTIRPLTERDCKLMQQHNTLRPDNPVACKRLRAVQFSYLSEQGIKSDGTLVVLDVAVPEVAALMQKLLEERFTIHQSRPLENYNGDDIASMNDNNTSAFNGRQTATSTRWSLHAYGVAIDINPLQNPVIYPNQREDADGTVVPGTPGTAVIRPSAASSDSNNYLNRNVYRARADDDGFYRPGMAESVANLFAYHGFLTWGGYWNDPLDYQHFEIGPRRFIERVYAADPADSTHPVNGSNLFNRYVNAFRLCVASKQRLVPDASQLRAVCARETINQFSDG